MILSWMPRPPKGIAIALALQPRAPAAQGGELSALAGEGAGTAPEVLR